MLSAEEEILQEAGFLKDPDVSTRTSPWVQASEAEQALALVPMIENDALSCWGL